MMIKNGRDAAMQALLQMEENEGYSNIVLDKTLRAARLDSRESSLASILFYGVLEKRVVLEWALAPFCRRPLDQLDLPVRTALFSAAYQILFLDKIPDSAAVNEAVEWIKTYGYGKAAGFVNGTLRNFLRGKEALSFPAETDSSLLALSLRSGIPQELLAFWQKAYGVPAAARFAAVLGKKAPLFGRVNETKLSVDEFCRRAAEVGFSARPVEEIPGCVQLTGLGSVGENPLYQQGLFTIQDASSQLGVLFSGVKPGDRVADVCAAPGGKSFSAGIRMQNCGEICSFDLYRGKVRQIREGAGRLGLSLIRAEVRDAAGDQTLQDRFDVVFCDVPCSGYGIIRRKPEIRYKTLRSVRQLPSLQARILDRSAALVKPGGTMMISTCTLVPDENEESVRRFLKRHPEFSPVPLPDVPGAAPVFPEPDWCRTLTPENAFGGDGFFVAKLQRSREEGKKEEE